MVGMRTRRIAVTAGVAAGFLLSACSGPGGGGETAPATQEEPKNVLAGVDPCGILSASDVQAFDVTEPGSPVDQGIGEQGCEYDAGDFGFVVYKAEDHDASYYERKKGNFFVYEPNQVGSHEGIKQITQGSQSNGICNQVILAGAGSAIVQVTYDADKLPGDEATCAKAMEIAQVVEPKLPK